MLNIYIARHGQDRDNANWILNGHRDEPLTDLGLEQAAALAAKIKISGLKFEKIYSSPLRRVRQTAAAVTKALDVPEAEVWDDLIERNFGVMSGQSITDIERLCAPDIIKTETTTYFLNASGAETFPETLERARKVLDRIKSVCNDGNVILFTSGDIGTMICAVYYNLDWLDALKTFHFKNSELMQLSVDFPRGKIIF